ncbi:MAG: RNA polymerase sigma factor (sigma-70 family) [Desulforhopalus sp.]
MTVWKERVFEHWDLITALSMRRFGATALAEEAVTAAIDGLSENDWQRVKSYQGKATFKSYLSVVVLRLFEDFSRKRSGRLRPPLWIRKLGGIWPKLFVALCLERFGVVSAVELVHQQQGKISQDTIEDAAYTLLGKIPNCGSQKGEKPLDETTESDFVVNSDESSRGRSYETMENVEFFENLFQAICGEKHCDFKRISSQYQSLNISLRPEERLLLKLHFQEGYNITEAGKMIDLTRFQVHGKMKRLMARLRDEFERVGLAEEILVILR